MSRRKNQNRLYLGDYNAICDVCGWKFKASDLHKRWDNLMVCIKDWEPKHPQLYIRAIPDMQRVPWVRPTPVDAFDSTTTFTSLGDADNTVPQGTFDNTIAGDAYNAPVPSISVPTDGATVSGNTTVTFTSTYLGNVNFGYLYVDTDAPFFYATNGSTSWDTTSLSDGAHTLTFKIIDTHGVAHTATITVTVSNALSLSARTSFFTV